VNYPYETQQLPVTSSADADTPILIDATLLRIHVDGVAAIFMRLLAFEHITLSNTLSAHDARAVGW
jgi:hypothetical protein